MYRIAYVLIVVSSLFFTACGANFASIYREYAVAPGATGILIDAKQRSIIVGRLPEDSDIERMVIACAEPSPDALSAISSSLSASGGGIFSGGEVEAAIATALTETASQLGTRNATITLLRDGLYRQCEAYMNGLITQFEYRIAIQKYINAMVALLAIEQIAPVDSTDVSVSSEENGTTTTSADINVTAPSEESEAGTTSGEAGAGTEGSPAESSETEPTDAGASAQAPSETGTTAATDTTSTEVAVGASGEAGASAVSVNIPTAPFIHVPPHVSSAVQAIVTSFFDKDSRDFCMSAMNLLMQSPEVQSLKIPVELQPLYVPTR